MAPDPQILPADLRFLGGGGAATDLILARDWTDHPLGPPAGWPEALKTALSLILNSPESMILCWGREPLHFFFNTTYFPLLGPRIEWAMGARFDKVWEDGLEQAIPIIADAFAGNSQHFVDLPWKLGTDRGAADTWWSFSYSRVLDAAGEIAGLFIFTNETTERVLADKTLTEAQDALTTLNETLERRVEERTAERDRMWNSSPDLMVEASLDGIYQRANPAWKTILGYEPTEVVGRSADFFTHPEDLLSMQEALATVQADTLPSIDLRFRHKDGSYRWIQWVAAPSFGLIFAIGRDVHSAIEAETLLKHTEDKLRQAQKMEAVGQLTGGIAHDFNNLLTVISGAAEMLKRPGLSEEKRDRYIDNIAETVKRASTLTGHLLAFSRRRAIQPEVIDINIQLDAMGEVLSRTLGNHIHVTVHPSPSEARVEVDPTELETAVLNAAVNARHAMPDGGDLRIDIVDATLNEEAAVAIEITDTGTGMSTETARRVFEPFFTTKPVGEGTGLGLSQIHGFAAQAGGDVEIHSRLDIGTTLRIILPRVDKVPTVVSPQHALVHIPEGLRVLLVEDNMQVLQFAEQLLRDLGSEVSVAHNGAEALRLLQEQHFDLLFTDVVMPGMTGIDLARQLRIRAPELPVLLATGYSEQIVGEGSAPFLVLAKPYGAQTLSTAIRKLLAQRAGTVPAD